MQWPVLIIFRNDHTQLTDEWVYLGTLHMVAALILLNGWLAVGTWFGVGQQPQAVSSILIGLAHTCHCGKHIFYLATFQDTLVKWHETPVTMLLKYIQHNLVDCAHSCCWLRLFSHLNSKQCLQNQVQTLSGVALLHMWHTTVYCSCQISSHFVLRAGGTKSTVRKLQHIEAELVTFRNNVVCNPGFDRELRYNPRKHSKYFPYFLVSCWAD